jgi:uncharacterized OsmC-like protein
MAKAEFIGGRKVRVEINGFEIKSDLPKSMNGDNEYPSPLDLLQGALLACATMHALAFAAKLNVDLQQMATELEPVFNEDGNISEAAIIIYVPSNFPPEAEKALIGAVENCIVGRHVNFPRNVVVVKR